MYSKGFTQCANFLQGNDVQIPACGLTEAYEPMLQWALPQILASAHYLQVVFGDISQNHGWARHFSHPFSDMHHLFPVFLKKRVYGEYPPKWSFPHGWGRRGISAC